LIPTSPVGPPFWLCCSRVIPMTFGQPLQYILQSSCRPGAVLPRHPWFFYPSDFFAPCQILVSPPPGWAFLWLESLYSFLNCRVPPFLLSLDSPSCCSLLLWSAFHFGAGLPLEPPSSRSYFLKPSFELKAPYTDWSTKSPPPSPPTWYFHQFLFSVVFFFFRTYGIESSVNGSSPFPPTIVLFYFFFLGFAPPLSFPFPQSNLRPFFVPDASFWGLLWFRPLSEGKPCFPSLSYSFEKFPWYYP